MAMRSRPVRALSAQAQTAPGLELWNAAGQRTSPAPFFT